MALESAPAVGAAAFGAFRAVFAAALAVLLLNGGIHDEPVPLELQRQLSFPGAHWIGQFAATPGAIGILQRALVATLIAFAAGIFARVAYIVLTVGFTLWFSTTALTSSAHPLGTLPLALVALLAAPWEEGVGVDWWRSRQPLPRSRVPYGYAPWVLCVALGVGFAAQPSRSCGPARNGP